MRYLAIGYSDDLAEEWMKDPGVASAMELLGVTEEQYKERMNDWFASVNGVQTYASSTTEDQWVTRQRECDRMVMLASGHVPYFSKPFDHIDFVIYSRSSIDVNDEGRLIEIPQRSPHRTIQKHYRRRRA